MKQEELIEEHARYLQNLPAPLQVPRVDADDAIAMLFGEDLFECDLKGGQVQIRGLGAFELETALPIGPPQWCAMISERAEGPSRWYWATAAHLPRTHRCRARTA